MHVMIINTSFDSAVCCRDRDMYMNQSVWEVDIVFTIVNGVAVLVCLLAAVLVFRLRLHKKIVYRLALYQVLSSLLFATVETMQIIFINYDTNPGSYRKACAAVGLFVMYTRWMKLLFTMWVTFHIFCFGLLRKNIDKLEVLYVVTSLLVPAMIAIVPLTTKTYLPYDNSGSNSAIFISDCYIYSMDKNVELIERFTLWDGPALVILLATSIGMVVMMITIVRLLYRKVQYDTTSDGADNYWKALKELLPLAAFPILFFIFKLPELVYDIYESVRSKPNEPFLAVNLLFISLWSLASGMTLIIHLSVAMYFAKKKKNMATMFSQKELEHSVYGST